MGIFSNREAVLRLFGALLIEQSDEWLVGKWYFSETSMRQLLVLAALDPALLAASVEEVAAA